MKTKLMQEIIHQRFIMNTHHHSSIQWKEAEIRLRGLVKKMETMKNEH